MVAENRIENLGQEVYRSLLNMIYGPLRDTVRARSLADIVTHEGFPDIVKVG